MKKKLYIKTAFLSLASMAMFSSCLKDDAHYIDFAGSKPLVELPAATGVGANGGYVSTIALPISTTPAEIDLAVNLAAPKPLSTNLTVKLAIDPTIVTNYNAAQAAAYAAAVTQYNSDLAAYNAGTLALKPTAPTAPTVYTLMPTDFYTIGSLTITIPAGKNLVNVPIMVTTSGFDLATHYVIPFKIIDGGGQQISNYNTTMFFVIPKNQWDGIYVDNGYSLRLGDAVRTGNFTGTKIALITAGPNSVNWSPVWADGSGVGGVGTPTITINPDNTITNTSSANGTWTNATGYNNVYDPVNHVFYISTVWSSPGTRATTDTLTYSGSR